MTIPRLSKKVAVFLLVSALSVTAGAVFAAQGVENDAIVIGTHLDLSGPLSEWGGAVRDGMELALDEANQAGGINGRIVRLIVRDDGYDPAQAADAVRSLVEEENVFAILSPLGTPTTNAAANEALDRDVLYLFPITTGGIGSDRQSPLMFALAQPTDEAIEQGLGRIQDIRPGAGVAVLASDDSFGRAARAGALRQLSASGHEILADVSFARGIDDYRTALNWLREREAGIIVLGALAEEALAIMRTARAMRWNPTFLCPSTCYTPEFAATGGEVTAGLYTVGDVPIPYATDPYLRDWSQRFEEKYGEPPSLQALAGYRNTSLFLAVLERTGRTTTRQSFRNALEVLGPWDDPANEGAAIYFSAEDHTARQSGFLAQARNGRWVIIEEASPTRL